MIVPDKFNMVDMEGIDLLRTQGVAVEGIYDKLVESITLCRYQCLYNWKFNDILIPPTYVEMEVNEDEEVEINFGITVGSDDIIHLQTIEPEPPAPVEPIIIPLLAEENMVYNAPSGVDGFDPVTVDVPSYVPVLQTLTITENGTYTPPTGVDGYNSIVVNVIPPTPIVPELVASYFMNKSSTDALSHEFDSGEYSILIIIPNSVIPISDLAIKLNSVDISSEFSVPISINSMSGFFYKSEFDSGDILTIENVVRGGNNGVQLYILSNTSIVSYYNKVPNNNSTFIFAGLLNENDRYLECAKYGYYNANNVIPEISVFYNQQGIDSTPCPNTNTYWYGGTYGLLLQP